MNWAPGPDVTRLLLLRHGEPEADSRGRCYGRLDVGLSDHGRDQAVRAARFLADAPIAAIYSSPRRRAAETARPLADARGLALVVREDLREIEFGRLEGMTFDEVRAHDPELYETWMTRPTTVTFPGGEGFGDLQRRVLALAGELRRTHAGTTIAVVAHGGVMRALLADALRLAREDVFRLDQSHGAVSVVDFLEDTAIVRLLNQVP
jgi:alpha-ribazole phosphatase